MSRNLGLVSNLLDLRVQLDRVELVAEELEGRCHGLRARLTLLSIVRKDADLLFAFFVRAVDEAVSLLAFANPV